jgi:Skp family chaperone for outer membrane proteins
LKKIIIAVAALFVLFTSTVARAEYHQLGYGASVGTCISSHAGAGIIFMAPLCAIINIPALFNASGPEITPVDLDKDMDPELKAERAKLLKEADAEMKKEEADKEKAEK